MIRRFHDDELPLGRIDPDVREKLQAGRLRPLRNQDHLDPADAYCRTISHRHLGRSEPLPGVALQTDDLDLGIDRLARTGRDLAAEAQADAGAQPGIETDANRDGIPDRAEAGALDVLLDQMLQDVGIVGRRAAAGIVRRIGNDDRQVVEGHAFTDTGRDAERLRRGLAPQADQFLAQLSRKRIGLFLVAVGNDQHPRADLRNVAVGKAVGDRHREDPVLAFHRHDPVDDTAHRLHRRRVALDLAAVIDRHDGLHLAAQRRQHEVEHILGALDDVGMGEFLVEDDDVGVRDALHREMAVRIELDSDHAFGPCDRAASLDDVAFDVVVAVRHHRAVKAQQQAVDRQRRLELAQDLVPHGLVVSAVGRAGGAGRKAASLDQLEALLPGTGARDEERCGAHAGRIGGMLASSEKYRLAIILQARRQGGEGVGFGCQRGREKTHGAPRGRCRREEKRNAGRWRRASSAISSRDGGRYGEAHA